MSSVQGRRSPNALVNDVLRDRDENEEAPAVEVNAPQAGGEVEQGAELSDHSASMSDSEDASSQMSDGQDFSPESPDEPPPSPPVSTTPLANPRRLKNLGVSIDLFDDAISVKMSNKRIYTKTVGTQTLISGKKANLFAKKIMKQMQSRR